MIPIDSNIYFLKKHYGIDTQRINEAGYTTIDEFMEAEAANGNQSAVDFEHDVYNNPNSILELYQLTSPKNRFLILANMNADELQELMQYLDPDILFDSLKYISQEKLLSMVYLLPKEKLATIVFNSFPLEDFLKVTNEREINKFFDSPKIERKDITKSLEFIDQNKLQGIMEMLTGQPCSHCDPKEVQEKLNALDDRQFARTLKAFSPETKSQIIMSMAKENPDCLLEFSNDAMMKPLTQLEKPDFLKTLAFLEPEDHLVMLQELPKDIMPMILTEIDPNVFAELLSANFKDLLKQISL